ncbi:MAG: hypothetical protein J5I93_02645 [Pirellulaceae bacterium]|nr:hypothetical protein [Pirellulaceae bacterium]
MLALLAAIAVTGCNHQEDFTWPSSLDTALTTEERVEVHRIDPELPPEDDWFADQEAWKEDLLACIVDLIKTLPDQQAQQVKLALRLHSGGAFLEWLLGETDPPAGIPLDARLTARLRKLQERWRELEGRLTTLPDNSTPVTQPDGERIAEQ